MTRLTFERTLYLFLGLVISVAISGCDLSTPSTPRISGPLVPVKGTVMLDGEPLPNADVSFIPDGKSDKSVIAATAKTDSSGKYQLRTDGKLGAPAGRYRVVVERWATPDGAPFREDPENGMDMEQARMAGKVKQSVPEKYSDILKTQLSAEVTADQKDPVDFALKSK